MIRRANLTRRVFGQSVVYAGAFASVGVMSGSNLKLPKVVGGIPVPTGKLADLAVAELIECSPPLLVNHAIRTFYFGCLIGRAGAKRCNEELLFLACVLHDLGLTAKHAGDLPFEIQAAQAARTLLTAAGLATKKAETVWDGIAMHTLAISDFKRPEISLVGAGAAADVTGSGLDLIDKSQVAEVLAAFPRLDFKRGFVRTCADAIRLHPRTAGRSFMRDIGERSVPGFHPPNICDRIDSAPFNG